jgi:hypothetical protein
MKLISKELYNQTISQYQYVLDKIQEICLSFQEPVEGNCMTLHNDIKAIEPSLIYKQINHFMIGQKAKNILEIGFNAGHSSLLYLISNPYSKIVAFDLCNHNYTIPCLEYLQHLFPGRLEMYTGNSNRTVVDYYKENPYQKFDTIHIDGCHDRDIANLDFFNCLKLASNIIIWDDTHYPDLNNLFNTYLSLSLIEEIYLYRTYTYEHRIGRIKYLA